MNVFLALPRSGKMMSPFFLLTFSDLDTMSKLKLFLTKRTVLTTLYFRVLSVRMLPGVYKVFLTKYST